MLIRVTLGNWKCLSSHSLFSSDEDPIRGMLLRYHSGKKTNSNPSFLSAHAAINSLRNISKWIKETRQVETTLN